MFLKKLFYASASFLMLALAYHLGASTATAQAPSNPVVGIAYTNWPTSGMVAITANGDASFSMDNGATWEHKGNFFSGPTPTATSSFGALKAKYR